jgi:hypothetical protein
MSMSTLLFAIALMLALIGSAILIVSQGRQPEVMLPAEIGIRLLTKCGLDVLFLAESFTLAARALKKK